MEALARADGSLTLRKIDVPNWQASVVKQHKIRSLPHLVLYERGKRVATGTESVLKKLNGRR